MKVGSRYCAPGTSAQIIVMRAPAQNIEMTIAGERVKPVEAASPPAPAPGGGGPASSEDALLVGKRYVDEVSGLEVLCTAAGQGPVTVDGRVLGTAAAKLLPSSD